MSFLGNLKDLFFLFRAGKRLRTKAVIHLHSGGFDKFYKRLFFVNKILNRYFLSKIGKGIVLSKSLIKNFSMILPENKIEIVPNFYDNNLLLDLNNIKSFYITPFFINII